MVAMCRGFWSPSTGYRALLLLEAGFRALRALSQRGSLKASSLLSGGVSLQSLRDPLSCSHQPEQNLGTIALKSLTLPLEAEFLSLMKFFPLVLDSYPVQPSSHRPEICDTVSSGLCGNLHTTAGGSRGGNHHLPEASWGRLCE